MTTITTEAQRQNAILEAIYEMGKEYGQDLDANATSKMISTICGADADALAQLLEGYHSLEMWTDPTCNWCGVTVRADQYDEDEERCYTCSWNDDEWVSLGECFYGGFFYQRGVWDNVGEKKLVALAFSVEEIEIELEGFYSNLIVDLTTQKSDNGPYDGVREIITQEELTAQITENVKEIIGEFTEIFTPETLRVMEAELTAKAEKLIEETLCQMYDKANPDFCSGM